jgi:tellurite resistance protein TerC
MIDRFHRLKTGLAVVLAFVGVKMCIAQWLTIPVQYSLLVIAAVLAGSIIASLAWPAEQDGAP